MGAVTDAPARAELTGDLDALVRAGARRMLAAALEAEVDAYARDDGVKWPKAVAKVTDDAEALLTFYDRGWLVERPTEPAGDREVAA